MGVEIVLRTRLVTALADGRVDEAEVKDFEIGLKTEKDEATKALTRRLITDRSTKTTLDALMPPTLSRGAGVNAEQRRFADVLIDVIEADKIVNAPEEQLLFRLGAFARRADGGSGSIESTLLQMDVLDALSLQRADGSRPIPVVQPELNMTVNGEPHGQWIQSLCDSSGRRFTAVTQYDHGVPRSIVQHHANGLVVTRVFENGELRETRRHPTRGQFNSVMDNGAWGPKRLSATRPEGSLVMKQNAQTVRYNDKDIPLMDVEVRWPNGNLRARGVCLQVVLGRVYQDLPAFADDDTEGVDNNTRQGTWQFYDENGAPTETKTYDADGLRTLR